MTRINVVPVETLCDKHLLAEHREITRIPNSIIKGRAVVKNIPEQYTLGKGHVKFFYDKIKYLADRYKKLYDECKYRGFNVKWSWPHNSLIDDGLMNNYVPSLPDILLNYTRILDRMPKNPKNSRYKREDGYTCWLGINQELLRAIKGARE